MILIPNFENHDFVDNFGQNFLISKNFEKFRFWKSWIFEKFRFRFLILKIVISVKIFEKFQFSPNFENLNFSQKILDFGFRSKISKSRFRSKFHFEKFRFRSKFRKTFDFGQKFKKKSISVKIFLKSRLRSKISIFAQNLENFEKFRKFDFVQNFDFGPNSEKFRFRSEILKNIDFENFWKKNSISVPNFENRNFDEKISILNSVKI